MCKYYPKQCTAIIKLVKQKQKTMSPTVTRQRLIYCASVVSQNCYKINKPDPQTLGKVCRYSQHHGQLHRAVCSEAPGITGWKYDRL